MMNRLMAAFFLALFIFPTGVCHAAGKVFMWEATRGAKLVYLLGSIHMADASFYPLDPAIEDAFDKSAMLVVEVDITNKQDPMRLQADVARKGLYTGSDSLENHISRETLDAVEEYLGEASIIMQILGKMKPWAVYLTLEQLEMEKIGLQAQLGIDLHLLNKANRNRKPVEELESMEMQINLISGFDDKTQEGLILMTVTESEKRQESVNSIIHAWKSGNAPLMESLLFSSLDDNPQLEPVFEKMFYERNIGMADNIERLAIPGEAIFVAVGAGHVLGDQGVLSLLEQKGYTTKQVGSAR